MKITRAQAEQFYSGHPKSEVKTFSQNYERPLLRVLDECLSEGSDIVKCLKDADNVIDKVLETYQNVNTRKVYLQAILWFIDNYEGLRDKVPREKYLTAWEESKLAVVEAPSKEYNDVPTPEQIQEAVDKAYGADSIQSLYISFYREVPMRLDYKDIKVYNSANQVPEDQKKYILYQAKKFVAKEYNKTSKKYGTAEYPLSPDLIQKIKDSLKKQSRDQLFVFSNANPSKAIAALLRGAGLDMTLNALRHSVSATAVSGEEKVKLARKMKHSITTAQKYRSQIKGDTTTIEIPAGMEDEIKQLIIDYLELHSQD